MTKLKFTRAEYMAASPSQQPAAHRRYYAQFVTPYLRTLVERTFTREVLLASTDPHLNDIALVRWDRLAAAARGTDGSLCERVCALKEAARQVIEGATVPAA